MRRNSVERCLLALLALSTMFTNFYQTSYEKKKCPKKKLTVHWLEISFCLFGSMELGCFISNAISNNFIWKLTCKLHRLIYTELHGRQFSLIQDLKSMNQYDRE